MPDSKNYGSITIRAGNVPVGQLWISTTSGSPTGGPYNQGDTCITEDGYMWVCSIAGSPGTWQQVGTGILNGAVNIVSGSATALTVAATVGSNYGFQVDESTVNAVTGLKVKSGIAGGGLALSIINGNAAENVTLDAKGSGTIGIGTVSTGAITLGQATTLSNGFTVTTGGGTISGGGLTVTGTTTLNTPLAVTSGGIGQATLTNHGVLVGAGTSLITQLAVGATNSVLQGSTGADPSFTTTPTISSITVSGDPGITLSTATSRIVPGATSLSLRNNANNTDNLIITDAGAVTTRAGLTINTGGLKVTGHIGLDATPATNYGILGATAITSDGSVGGHIFSTRAGSITAATNADNLVGLAIQHTFALSTFTGVNSYGIDISPSWAAQATSSNVGIRINNITGATNTNTGIDIFTPSGATNNYGLRLRGGSPALLIDAGGLQVTAGNVGIGTAPVTSSNLISQGGTIVGDGGSNAGGALFNPTCAASVTNIGYGVAGNITTAASAFTMLEARAITAGNPTKGSGSVITTLKGLNVDPMTAGGTNNYGVYINAPSGGSTANLGLANLGQSAFGSLQSDLYGLPILVALKHAFGTTTLANDLYLVNFNGLSTATINTNITNVAGMLGGYPTTTINGSKTVTRAAGIYLSASSITVTGTLTNNNMLYMETPVNGTTVRVIDTAAGGFLTTGGIWTNNPSWAHLKEAIRPATEVDNWMKFMAEDHQPVWYRYQTRKDEEGKILAQDQDYEHDHFGFLLDDIKAGSESLFHAITNDETGSISTKDSEGVLFAMVANLAKRILKLESELNGSLR